MKAGHPEVSHRGETQGPVQLTSYFTPTDASMSSVSSYRHASDPGLLKRTGGWRARYADKKEKKISSFIRKFRRDRLQRHIWLKATSYMVKYLCIFHILGSPSPWLCNRSHLNSFIYEANFVIFFNSVVWPVFGYNSRQEKAALMT